MPFVQFGYRCSCAAASAFIVSLFCCAVLAEPPAAEIRNEGRPQGATLQLQHDQPTLLESSPTAVRDALNTAAAHLQRGAPAAAREALSQVRMSEPDNPWLWFYLGMADAQESRPHEAIRRFERAAALLAASGVSDPPFADQIARQLMLARREILQLSLTTGLAFDSNVTFSGEAPGVALITGEEDALFETRLRLDYAPIAEEHRTLAVGLRTTNNWHFSIKSFDEQEYGGYVRYAHRWARRWALNLRYDYDFTLLGRDRFLSNHAVTSGLTYSWSTTVARWQPIDTAVFHRIEVQDFLFDITPAFDRDGVVNTLGVEQGLDWRPVAAWDWHWTWRFGYTIEYVATEGTEFDRTAHTFYAGLFVPIVHPHRPHQYLLLPELPLVARIEASWQVADYRHRSLIDRDRAQRYDEIVSVAARLSQTLADDHRRGRVVLHGLIGWSDYDSNIELSRNVEPYSYERLVAGVQLEWAIP